MVPLGTVTRWNETSGKRKELKGPKIKEDFEEELHSPDCMDMRISAEDELRMYNLEDLENNRN